MGFRIFQLSPKSAEKGQKSVMQKRHKRLAGRPFDLQSDALPTELWEFEITPRLITARMAMLYQEVHAVKKTRKYSMAG
jgi:hypothetical protein